MPKPAANDRDVDTGRDEVDGGSVAEAVRRHMLAVQRWLGSGGRFHIARKFEPDARGAERFAITVHEQPLVRCSRFSLQQLFQQQHSFRPERADAFLAALACQAHATWTIEADHLWAQIERFLYSRPAVVKEREQRVIAQALNGRAIWLGNPALSQKS